MDADSKQDLWKYVYTLCHRCSLHHSSDSAQADICAVEFAEQILLLRQPAERDALVAPENHGLLYRQAAFFVLNRRQGEDRRHLHEQSLSGVPESVLSSLEPSLDLCTQVHNSSLRGVLLQAVVNLPARQRQCAYRCWFKQETDTEAAFLLNMTPAAVRKNLQYARAKMPVILKRMGVDLKDLL